MNYWVVGSWYITEEQLEQVCNCGYKCGYTETGTFYYHY